MIVFEKLRYTFCEQNSYEHLEIEVEENHKILIENLSKEHRKIILKIIDTLMLINTLQTNQSFMCGFKLAVDMTTELQEYTQDE